VVSPSGIEPDSSALQTGAMTTFAKATIKLSGDLSRLLSPAYRGLDVVQGVRLVPLDGIEPPSPGS